MTTFEELHIGFLFTHNGEVFRKTNPCKRFNAWRWNSKRKAFVTINEDQFYIAPGTVLVGTTTFCPFSPQETKKIIKALEKEIKSI